MSSCDGSWGEQALFCGVLVTVPDDEEAHDERDHDDSGDDDERVRRRLHGAQSKRLGHRRDGNEGAHDGAGGDHAGNAASELALLGRLRLFLRDEVVPRQ